MDAYRFKCSNEVYAVRTHNGKPETEDDIFVGKVVLVNEFGVLVRFSSIGTEAWFNDQYQCDNYLTEETTGQDTESKTKMILFREEKEAQYYVTDFAPMLRRTKRRLESVGLDYLLYCDLYGLNLTLDKIERSKEERQREANKH